MSAATVAGVTTARSSTTAEIPPTTKQESTTTTAADPGSSVERPGELDPVEPTGLDVALISFDDSVRLIQPDGSVTLLARDDAVRVAGDTRGGVVFQRELVPGPQSSLLWQPAGAIVPEAVFVPKPDQKVELHGVTTVTAQPEFVFSVTSESSTNRSLNRLDPNTGVVTELAVVDDAEFGSKSTQVDGLFIVTTWQRPEAAGWTVYQSGTGREIGGSFPDVEAACADGEGFSCARLASLSLDIELVFRIVPHDVPAQPGRYDLLVSRSENGATVTRVDLTSLEGEWFPEHLSELPAGRILLSRSVDPGRLRPTTGVVIDPASGSVESLTEIGFVRLP
ncbi:MAG: hypothetical protein HKN24_05735 [Acidimicrobiales bacterium]|nr:hypothetical protein [Acidimicrobiales bacterium]